MTPHVLTLLQAYWPLLLPVALLQWTLAIVALIHVLRHRSFRFGNTVFWALLVLLIGYLGPILYFTVGKAEQPWTRS